MNATRDFDESLAAGHVPVHSPMPAKDSTAL
jgi:hypothetical protein